MQLRVEDLVGDIAREEDDSPLPGASWYLVRDADSRLMYTFPAGALPEAKWLTADMLVDGDSIIVFALSLQEGAEGPTFHLIFCALPECQLRVRFRLSDVDQNRWLLGREGAYIKPMAAGDRVDLAKVDRMVLTVSRKAEAAQRFCLTDFAATAEEPARLTDPILPKGKLLDELGQSAIRDWPTKSRSAEEVTARLKQQLADAPAQCWPEGYSRWGGSKEIEREATGFFRTHRDGKRWWLVDPEGYAFWSSGIDCVRVDTELAYAGLETALSWLPDPAGPYGAIYSYPDQEGRQINYLQANLIRAFGDEWHEKWATIALAELKRLGFNTVANWSDWQIAKAAGVPYVRPLHFSAAKTPDVYRDFPDVFAPSFAQDAATFAEQLRETAEDPALIGYFLMNEPTWGFAEETPAAGMLFNTPTCATRQELARFLTRKHGDDDALSATWGLPVTFSEIAQGEWRHPLTEGARADLAAFSTVMVERLFTTLTEACRKVDPHHLNLGARYASVPPDWALEGMKCFDVFSVNCYEERVNPEFGKLSEKVQRPIMVGEYHFGALDVGLPASGIGRVKDQAARGQAFRVYLEDAAAKPWCIGVHYFTLYDQSALGRFDGEAYNIGFLDVCNRPYAPLCAAARASHARLYRVATGKVAPYADAPEYLLKLFA